MKDEKMVAITPLFKRHEGLPDLASRFVEVDEIPWKPTPCKGIEMKVLMEDEETGMMTAMFKWAPGSKLTFHEHIELEQTFVLEGSLVDDEGTVSAGNYVWRPAGSRHDAWAPDGALILSMFLKPNKFLGGDNDGVRLK